LTNVLIEGGAQLLGSAFDAGLVDEAHVFIAPKLSGGADAASPLAGVGVTEMSQALPLERRAVRDVNGDIYISGRIARNPDV
jgi:diaminohydroxyphosphoribosylaminopyrimidine deaminase/5-amino-6-(5-phosphoribosylamino)uracil reductase